MYLNTVLDHIAKLKGKEYRATLCTKLSIPSSFNMLVSYPVRDLTRIMQAATPEIFPGMPLLRAIFEWGALGYTTFCESFIGKVGLVLVTKDVDKLVKNIPSYYNLSSKLGPITVVNDDANTYRVCFRHLNGYTEYQHGLIATALKGMGHNCEVSHTLLSFEDRGDGDLWAEADIIVRILGR
jgi:uncharacterized protein (TIGR02265 family)